MPIFHDQTVIDLAVEFDCIRFLAHCMVATQDSLYGDMEVRHGARGVEALKEKRRQEHTCFRLPASFSLTLINLEP